MQIIYPVLLTTALATLAAAAPLGAAAILSRDLDALSDALLQARGIDLYELDALLARTMDDLEDDVELDMRAPPNDAGPSTSKQVVPKVTVPSKKQEILKPHPDIKAFTEAGKAERSKQKDAAAMAKDSNKAVADRERKEASSLTTARRAQTIGKVINKVKGNPAGAVKAKPVRSKTV